MEHRFYGDESKNQGKYCVMDRFTGTMKRDNLDAEGAEGECERLNKEYDEAKKVVDEVSRFVNRGGAPEYFATAMSQEHRTLQQGFTKVAVAWIEQLAAKEDGYYDARNEDSVRLAKAIVAMPEWERVKYLRYI